MLKIYRLVGPFLVLQCLLVAAAAAAAFFMERLGVRSGVDDVVVSEGARVRASAASSTTRGSLAQTVPNMAANGMHSTVADMAEKEQYIETRSDKSPILLPGISQWVGVDNLHLLHACQFANSALIRPSVRRSARGFWCPRPSNGRIIHSVCATSMQSQHFCHFSGATCKVRR